MAIRGAQEPVPPPLPPPSYIPEITAGHDPGWQWGNDPNKSDFGRPASVKPGSSLLGGGNGNGFGAMKSARQEKEHEYPQYCSADDVRRGSSVSTLTITRDHYDMPDGSRTPSDEGGSLSRPSSNYRYVCSHFISVCTVCVTSHPSNPTILQPSQSIRGRHQAWHHDQRCSGVNDRKGFQRSRAMADCHFPILVALRRFVS